MTITSNSTLIRIFLNSDVEIKKLKKKRYLIKVTLDNGMIVQMNDVPFEVNDEFIDFKLNNSNQMIAKQLADTANAVLIKTPSSVIIKTEDKQEDIIMNNEINKTNTETTNQINKEEINMIDIINKTKGIIESNDGLLKYYTSGTLDLDTAVSALTLPLNIALKHIQDEKSKEELINKFFNELKNPSKETINNVEAVAKAMVNFEEKLAKVPAAIEINRQATEQLKASCEKLSQEAEEIVSGKQPQKQSNDEKSSLDNKEFVKEETLNKLENNPEDKFFCDNKAEESTLYTVAKIAGKVTGVAALGVVGFLAYGFIKSKLD